MNLLSLICFVLAAALILLGFVMLVRNQIVFKVRSKVDDWVFGNYPDDRPWDWVERNKHSMQVLGSYDDMMWNWRKWTFKQFTKGLWDQ